MKKEKSCSLGGNEGFPTSISFDGRDRRKMTCIIHAKNKTETIVVSDSWNTNPKNNHLTQKIVYNEQFPCIIGHTHRVYQTGIGVKLCQLPYFIVANRRKNI